MKALILAAGFGTRLEKALTEDVSGRYKHLVGIPKPLLPIAGKSLIDYLIEEINKHNEIDEVYIITNQTNYRKFEEWAKNHSFPAEHLVNDGTLKNEERLGAVGDIALAIKEKKIDDDLLIVAGDTLFYPDFSLEKVLAQFYEKGNMVLCYQVGGREEIRKRGILEMDGNGRVVNFLEKPSPEETSSRWACPPLYIYRKEMLPLLKDFLRETEALPVAERDAPGKLAAWLYLRVPIYAFKISGRFDVGGLTDYKKADEFFNTIIFK